MVAMQLNTPIGPKIRFDSDGSFHYSSSLKDVMSISRSRSYLSVSWCLVILSRSFFPSNGAASDRSPNAKAEDMVR